MINLMKCTPNEIYADTYVIGLTCTLNLVIIRDMESGVTIRICACAEIVLSIERINPPTNIGTIYLVEQTYKMHQDHHTGCRLHHRSLMITKILEPTKRNRWYMDFG